MSIEKKLRILIAVAGEDMNGFAKKYGCSRQAVFYILKTHKYVDDLKKICSICGFKLALRDANGEYISLNEANTLGNSTQLADLINMAELCGYCLVTCYNSDGVNVEIEYRPSDLQGNEPAE